MSRKILSLLAATAVLLLSVVIGHFFPPLGIFMIPAVVIIVTAIICGANGFNLWWKVLLCYLFIGMNDIGQKLFAGGIHDWQGMGVMHLLLFVGLFFCLLIIIGTAFTSSYKNIFVKLVAVLLFIVLMALHLQQFQYLGLEGRYAVTS